MDGETVYQNRHSKISNLLEESKNETNIINDVNIKSIKEEEISEDSYINCNLDEEENSHYILNSINNNFNIYKQFKIYFYLSINENKDYVFPIKTDIFNIKKHCVSDLIRNIVKKINKKKLIININSINYTISLREFDEENNNELYEQSYELKEWNKKDLKPINDAKEFASDLLLKEIINEKISFVSKNPINIMLIEKYEDCNFERMKGTINKKKIENNKSYNIFYYFKFLYEYICFYNISSNTQNYIW